MSGLVDGAPRHADRRARLELSLAVDAADVWLGRLLEDHPAAEVLAAIRTGRLADLVAGPDLVAGSGPRGRLKPPDRVAKYRLRLDWSRVDEAVATAETVGATFVVPGDSRWPSGLDDLGPQRPVGLWTLGVLDRCVDPVSIVGARACTAYGSYVASAIGAELAEAGASVVSGAALGVDAAAHRGALAVGGPTVAVLACGIDVAYPRAHDALLRSISGQGMLLTELAPGSRPSRFTFLRRNRIIAALGRATVVVEAARRSGSLVTARQAAELGRPVLAVPGPITSELSHGTHELIRDGATLVTGAGQVREACMAIGSLP